MDTWIRAKPVDNQIELSIVLFCAMKYPVECYSFLKVLKLNQDPVPLCLLYQHLRDFT